VVGEVLIDMSGSDAGIFYAVFPSRAAAVADYEHPAPVANKVTAHLAAPASLPRPASVEDGSIAGTNAAGHAVTMGVTAVSFVDGNVDVAAITTSTKSATHGDRAGAYALAAFAVAHLKQLRR
jgi:hypothetical protein